jgi:hypothetical protein
MGVLPTLVVILLSFAHAAVRSWQRDRRAEEKAAEQRSFEVEDGGRRARDGLGVLPCRAIRSGILAPRRVFRRNP